MKITRKMAAGAAFAATAALVLTACGGNGNNASGPATEAPDEKPASLTLATWTNVSPETLQAFEDETGIAVTIQNFADSQAAQSAIQAGLTAGGAGLSDVHFLEGDWLTEMFAHPDDWAELPAVDGRWVDWTVERGKSDDGAIRGYGTDIGPLAVAFNSEIMEELGLPSTPDAFADFIGGADGTWEDFIAAGQQVVEASNGDVRFVDTITTSMQAAINLIPGGAFEDPETGNPIPVEDNETIHELFMMFANAIEGDSTISANINFWEDGWSTGFHQKQFAAVIAPAWMTGMVQQAAEGVTGWQVATTFPGGGGNWGGSFLAVPSTGDNIYWATQLADFLTTPEAAIAQFEVENQFPSQVEALEDPRLMETPNEFFGGQHLGAVYSELAAGTPTLTFRGQQFTAIQNIFMEALGRVMDGIETPEEAWTSSVANFNAQVDMG
ncbi:MAG: ABC transporter substrate-binding protein [Cellulomonadaceae bacterium]|jgi:cellobiose transport system substrate-binding protein|nr:ABC transporter substrate-binding protein [Cellulomonadaceae bacterium]